MLKVGITGGIGSGKSLVCRIFGMLGIPVYNADDAAKRIMHQNPEVKTRLQEKFGNIYNEDGSLNSKLLSEQVFHDPAKLALLNSIVHPAVIKDYEDWEKSQQGKYFLRESAILFESGTDKGLDYVITVEAPEKLKIDRVVRRDKRTAEEVRSIMNRQMSEAERRKKADFVLINDEETALLPQIWLIHEKMNHG